MLDTSNLRVTGRIREDKTVAFMVTNNNKEFLNSTGFFGDREEAIEFESALEAWDFVRDESLIYWEEPINKTKQTTDFMSRQLICASEGVLDWEDEKLFFDSLIDTNSKDACAELDMFIEALVDTGLEEVANAAHKIDEAFDSGVADQFESKFNKYRRDLHKSIGGAIVELLADILIDCRFEEEDADDICEWRIE